MCFSKQRSIGGKEYKCTSQTDWIGGKKGTRSKLLYLTVWLAECCFSDKFLDWCIRVKNWIQLQSEPQFEPLNTSRASFSIIIHHQSLKQWKQNNNFEFPHSNIKQRWKITKSTTQNPITYPFLPQPPISLSCSHSQFPYHPYEPEYPPTQHH